MPVRRPLTALVALTIAALATVASLSVPLAAAPVREARFEAAPGETLLVHGEFPPTQSTCVDPTQPLVHERYLGAVEVVRGADGRLTLIGELPFEEYLTGIAEVPRSWPLEALKAQVVAARSFATVQIEREDSPLYDLCATDACQVYVGTGVSAGPWGERWVRAVRDTAGEVLLHAGRPAEAFYFSTSNGRTFTNQEVWGSDPLPYLPSVREEDDGESPVSRWRVEIPFEDLGRFYAAHGDAVGTIERVRVRPGGAVRLVGDARIHTSSREELRGIVNELARCLMPGRYPQTTPAGSRLPQPVPSKWFEPSVEGRSLVLEGRGWGHGIGLVQWGAKGKADRGLGYGDILAAYYGGLRPAAYEVPGTIRVLLATGLTRVTIAPSGEATASVGRDGPWVVTPAGPERVRVRRGSPPAPELEITDQRLVPGGPGIDAAFRSGSDVRARLEYFEAGERTGLTTWGSYDDGVIRIAADPPPGQEVRVRATDGVDTVLTGPLTAGPPLEESPETPVPAPTTSPDAPPVAAPASGGSDGPSVRLIAGAALLAAIAALALAAARRRRLH